MPHCVVEHSASIDGELILPLVFSGALKSALFEVDGSDIKVRARSYSSYLTGPKKFDFIHVTLKILSGRTLEQKQILTKAVLERLQQLELRDCSISVEAVDIERASYSKILSQTLGE